jgi:hypothetical protein
LPLDLDEMNPIPKPDLLTMIYIAVIETPDGEISVYRSKSDQNMSYINYNTQWYIDDSSTTIVDTISKLVKTIISLREEPYCIGEAGSWFESTESFYEKKWSDIQDCILQAALH